MQTTDIDLSLQLVMEAITAKALYFTHHSRKELWTKTQSVMAHQTPNQRYFFTAVSTMEQDNRAMVAFREHQTPYLTLTDDGRRWFRTIQPKLIERLQAVQNVARAVDYDLTKDGQRPSSINVLEGRDRTFFSTIISAMDLFRYFVLRDLSKNKKRYVVMADIMDEITKSFGWHPSKAYIYKLVVRMEDAKEGALLEGQWDDPRIRGKRYWRITEAGKTFYPDLEANVAERVRNAYHFMDTILTYLQQKET